MNWRRGLLFAAIHVALAAPLLTWQTAMNFATEKTTGEIPSTQMLLATLLKPAPSDTVEFSVDPCQTGYVDYFLSPIDSLMTRINVPATILTGWSNPCPPRWTLASVLQPGTKHHARTIAYTMVAGFSTLIAIQWLLVGSLPVARPKRRWLEPGAFITICACSGGIPLLVYAGTGIVRWIALQEYAHAPDLFVTWAELMTWPALVAWLWWFALLVWKAFRAAWLLLSRRHATPAA